MKKNIGSKKASKCRMYKALFVLCLAVGFVWGLSSVVMVEPEPESDFKVETWHTIYEGPIPLGENEPGYGTAGFMSIFCLDYAQDPDSAAAPLENNATDWEASENVHGYADSDEFVEDLKSDDPFRFVVRAKFTDTEAMDNGVWNWDDMRCSLEVSGDESFNFTGDEGVSCAAYYNSTTDESNNCGSNISASDDGEIWVNFWFDDGDDGYQISEDGEIVVVWIKLEAKY